MSSILKLIFPTLKEKLFTSGIVLSTFSNHSIYLLLVHFFLQFVQIIILISFLLIIAFISTTYHSKLFLGYWSEKYLSKASES
ncbi:hypothetical protein [Spiroplasma endosymbiont of Atherix ibis]|uniref:hypothetical protein n=1 Tax=Spiroplasma endosymbiont of Atherix ibis TaxID=3066291 RepID=UPI0030D126D2